MLFGEHLKEAVKLFCLFKILLPKYPLKELRNAGLPWNVSKLLNSHIVAQLNLQLRPLHSTVVKLLRRPLSSVDPVRGTCNGRMGREKALTAPQLAVR